MFFPTKLLKSLALKMRVRLGSQPANTGPFSEAPDDFPSVRFPGTLIQASSISKSWNFQSNPNLFSGHEKMISSRKRFFFFHIKKGRKAIYTWPGKGYPLQYSGLENSMDFIYSPWGLKESDMTLTFTCLEKVLFGEMFQNSQILEKLN